MWRRERLALLLFACSGGIQLLAGDLAGSQVKMRVWVGLSGRQQGIDIAKADWLNIVEPIVVGITSLHENNLFSSGNPESLFSRIVLQVKLDIRLGLYQGEGPVTGIRMKHPSFRITLPAQFNSGTKVSGREDSFIGEISRESETWRGLYPVGSNRFKKYTRALEFHLPSEYMGLLGSGRRLPLTFLQGSVGEIERDYRDDESKHASVIVRPSPKGFLFLILGFVVICYGWRKLNDSDLGWCFLIAGVAIGVHRLGNTVYSLTQCIHARL